MLRPAINDYIGTLENPVGVFRSLGEPCVERDVWGAPRFRAGNSAAVFTCVGDDGRRRILKCYIRANPYLRAIYGYVERRRPALLPALRLLPDEMFVHTLGGEAGWVDVVEGEWTEGETLSAAVSNAVRTGNGVRLEGLADAFDRLWAELSAVEWAHGDLKPDNIVVRPDGRLTLIDCDAMWIPELAGLQAVEMGTPPWCDTDAGAAIFNKTIDERPARLIGEALRIVAKNRELWPKYTALEQIL